MSMALSDFYSSTNDTSHRRRLVLHIRDSQRDITDAASQAADLIQNVGVQAIVGPSTSLQAIFMADIGNKAQVPIISFTATSPSVSTSQNPYFIRTTQSDLSQVNVIAELVKTFGWREVVPVYEDTEDGKGVMLDLIDSFQAIDTRVPYRSVISTSATDGEILSALYELMAMRTRVFVVHMTPALGIRVFQKAKMIGMMSKGYSWIITDGLANYLGSFNSSVIDSMQGVLGVRPYIPSSTELDEFRARWRKQFFLDNPGIENVELNIFGLRAYDTVRALASVLEKLDKISSISKIGPKLLQLISRTKFYGLGGDINLINRELQSNTFQLLNVIGNGGREIGIWTASNGILRDSSSLITTRENSFFSPRDNLRVIIWPGESTVIPKCWVVPEMGKMLRIGVPVKRGFTEFVKVTRNSSYNSSAHVTGYCIDVFKAVIEMLPYPVSYEFVPFAKADGTTAGTYNDLNYDAVVGDITISANRSTYVDFTLPYTPSGFSMIVPLKDHTSNNPWILLKPLNWELWVAITGFFLMTWAMTWALEREESNPAFQGGAWNQLETMFWFFFSTPGFADQKRVHNGMVKVVLIVWVFVLVLLSSSYTASLTSMLTVHRLEPTVTDVHELIKTRQNVGYLEGTFVYTMLKRMGFYESNLKPYISTEDFKEAFTELRNMEDRIVSAFDEAPYNKLLLAKYCHKYALVGPMYKTEGFGFISYF
ncbi:glutamate receptor 2.2-like [Papaver somniferum]|uniref:glutamate receptor 2.2-like n=1 Tax=Papaver somniferum TaxID=3469 RepID=UPI000E700BD1|nr:glutamate receptor 2.2-like [Papaver somniferum]